VLARFHYQSGAIEERQLPVGELGVGKGQQRHEERVKNEG
jgi:hypothetical protein